MTTPANIAAVLPEVARNQPFKPAIVFPNGRDRNGKVCYTHYTYAQLNDESDRMARGLEKIGIGRGVRTVLMVKPSLEFFALTFGLFKAGAVPVLVDPGIGLKSLHTCLAQAEPQAFIGIPTAHVARVLFGWAKASLTTFVTVGRRAGWSGTTLAQVRTLGGDDAQWSMAPTTEDETAAILFTSGSTGVPKGVVYRHGTFLAQVHAIRNMYGIEPGEIDLPTFPLFALFDPAFGMTTIVPDMDATRPAKVDPRKVIEAVQDFGVTNMFGSTALLNTVGRYGSKHGVKLPSLKRVISAGAPVPAVVMQRFLTMLDDDAVVVTPYGATVSLPVATISSREVLGETAVQTERGAGVCVGRPVPEIDVRVIEIRDDVIATWSDARGLEPGEIGEIVVRGPMVTRSYFQRKDATALAKITDGNGLWHRMGDVGYFDEQGRLWFCGRKAHRVVTVTQTLFSVPCEGIFNAHPRVFRSALVGVANGKGAQMPVLCVELEPGTPAAEQPVIARQLLDMGAQHPITASIDRVLFHRGFPVDIRHNAKIGREKLAQWAAKELAR